MSGLLIAHGFESLILTSPDGITWTQRHFTSSGPEIRDLWWDGNDHFVGVGNSIFTSTDGAGVTWTDTQDNVFLSPFVNPGNYGSAILFAASTWVGAGSLTSARANAIAPTSPAGSSWALNEQTGTRTIKVGSGATGFNSDHDVTFTEGAGMAGLMVGDIMVVAAVLTPDPGNFAPTVATGWTASTLGTNPVTYVWVKTATAGDVSGGSWNFSWTATGSVNNPVAAVICAFRNVTGGVYTTANSTGTGTSVNFPSAMSTGPSAAINVFGGVDPVGDNEPTRSGTPCTWNLVASQLSDHIGFASASIDITFRLIGFGGSPTTAMTITNPSSKHWTDIMLLVAGQDFGDLFYAVASDGFNLVAVGKRGLIYRSTNNGATWTTVFNSASCNDYTGIIWNGTYFLAFQLGGLSFDMAKSMNGTSWTETLSTQIAPTDIYWDTGFNLWIAAGQASGDALGKVYTSADGQSWTMRYAPASGNGVQAVQHYTSGAAATGDIDVFATTANGTTWTQVVAPNGASVHLYTVLRWTGALFVVLDLRSGGIPNFIRTSPDGITWTDRYTDSVPDIDSIKQFGVPSVVIVFSQC